MVIAFFGQIVAHAPHPQHSSVILYGRVDFFSFFEVAACNELLKKARELFLKMDSVMFDFEKSQSKEAIGFER
jgi:hypothetical protein